MRIQQLILPLSMALLLAGCAETGVQVPSVMDAMRARGIDHSSHKSQAPASVSVQPSAIQALQTQTASVSRPAVPSVQPVSAPVFSAGSVTSLAGDSGTIFGEFQRRGYTLAGVKASGRVPPVYVARMPRDIGGYRPDKDRRALFIQIILPLIANANARAEAQRQQILASGASGSLSTAPGWIAALGRDLRASSVEELLQKLGPIPPSLAVAQSIEESGWGRSRFAQNGNALVGQRTWRTGDSGMTPSRRDSGQSHRVRAFANLQESIDAYVRNLNRHANYADLRRARNRGASGYELAGLLKGYSETGSEYTRNLRALMDRNDLRSLDFVKLAPGAAAVTQR